jgi:hypothetical protein
MKKIHVVAVAGLLGFAAVLGVVGATRTTGIGVAAHAKASKSLVAQLRAREHQLRQMERALARARRSKPPALPRVPAVHHPAPPPAPPAAPVAAPPAAVAPAAPRIIYRRPAPIVIVHHTHHGDDGHESEGHGGGGGDD